MHALSENKFNNLWQPKKDVRFQIKTNFIFDKVEKSAYFAEQFAFKHWLFVFTRFPQHTWVLFGTCIIIHSLTHSFIRAAPAGP